MTECAGSARIQEAAVYPPASLEINVYTSYKYDRKLLCSSVHDIFSVLPESREDSASPEAACALVHSSRVNTDGVCEIDMKIEENILQMCAVVRNTLRTVLSAGSVA